ncbi:hypothetical protein [Nocardia sp. NPDC052566]|uniref:hypothetical protein n=1 Tax=Nocardia sp. NPDC052566 TaxID=3364330 RepID=UPI0037C78781
MRIKKFLVTAALTVAATGIAAGTAHAGPHAETIGEPVALQGADHGAAFTISWPADSADITVALNGGRFVATSTGFTVTDASGARIGEVPFRFATDEATVDLAPTVDQTGTRLTVEPIDRVLSQRQLNTEVGAGIGGTIGFVTGAFLGLFGLIGFGGLAIITIPAGMLLGALAGAGIGGDIGAAIPASDEPTWFEYKLPPGIRPAARLLGGSRNSAARPASAGRHSGCGRALRTPRRRQSLRRCRPTRLQRRSSGTIPPTTPA